MEINILIEEGIEAEAGADWLQRVVDNSLLAENMPPHVEISLVVTGQERMQELNRQYRGQDRPTDVLSFAMSESSEDEPAAFIGPPDGLLHLGEIIVSYPQSVIQAQEHGHSIKKEMAILIIHGVLHILGYDHEKPDMEAKMLAREKDILAVCEKELL
jgi:probable rRNA maturation factor